MGISLTYEDSETFSLICKLCWRYAIDPGSPDPNWNGDRENYFRKLLAEYDGPLDKKSLTVYLNKHLAEDFIAYKRRPRWIQSAEWPFYNGKPMIFVGQIDIPKTASKGDFHDDTSFYIFRPQGRFFDDECKVIVQQY